MALAHPTTSRRIYFYRIDPGTDEHGSPRSFSNNAAIEQIGGLKSSDRLYLAEGDNVVFALVDSAGTPIKLRFVRSRRADLPQMEEDGAVKELAIPKHAGVADSTHLVFFAKGLVGADWNYHGPRATALAHYINVKTEPASLISIRPLLRADLASALDRLQSVRVLDLKIRSSYIPTVRDVSGTLADAFESAREVGGAQEVGILLRPSGRARGSRLAEGIMPVIRGLLSHELRGEVTRFQITGRSRESGRLETFDLLKEHLVFHEEVLRINPSTRALDPESAYAAIQRVYQEHHADLDRAPTIY